MSNTDKAKLKIIILTMFTAWLFVYVIGNPYLAFLFGATTVMMNNAIWNGRPRL